MVEILRYAQDDMSGVDEQIPIRPGEVIGDHAAIDVSLAARFSQSRGSGDWFRPPERLRIKNYRNNYT